jgi:hypothetical protein
MIIETPGSLEDYFAAADGVSGKVCAAGGPIMDCLRKYHGYFSGTLWKGAALGPAPALTSMNAFMLWLAAVRTAASGHAAAVFPLLRTSLESACYAFLIKDEPDLASVWLERHASPEKMKLCRKRFTSAVKDVAAAIEREQPDGGAWILEAYDLLIDFGAHPNVKSVLGHLVFEEDRGDEYHRMNLVGVYGPESIETQRALLACLDVGLATAVVLTRAQLNPTQAHQDELAALNDAKNGLVDTEFALASDDGTAAGDDLRGC